MELWVNSFCLKWRMQHAKQPSTSIWQLSKWSSLCPHWFFIFLLSGKYPQDAPRALHSFTSYLCGTCPTYLSIHLLFTLSLGAEQTAQHLRELNGFQLAKQIPSLALAVSQSAWESLGGHYTQLEFNKPNMLTILMELEGRVRGGREAVGPHRPYIAVYLLFL